MSHPADAEAWTISYLSARGDSPWRWADDGEVLAWADGTTIAFRGEIAYILEWLIPHGWPPFGALVWLLAATRGKLPPRSEFDPTFALPPNDKATDPTRPTLALFHDRLRAMCETVEKGLGAISALPENQRSSLEAKAILAERIFSDMPDELTGAAKRSKAIEILRSGLLTDAMLNDRTAPPAESHGEWLALHQGLKEFTAESLELRAKTGLDELPEPAEVPEIASVRVRALLNELRTDDEYAGFARLTRDFMAALQLPRRLSEPDEMPIGGFADLSNRGNLDRLLLSELAHDDLTLAVRIALNEALYLRREPPSKQPPSTLAILIDCGVRQWGVPRVLSTAIALALIAKSAGPQNPIIFRASGEKLQPVDLLTRKGLIAHLGTLEPGAHPGPALDPFRKIVDTYERAEAVLVTHRDVLHDAAFQRNLAAANFEMLYVAVVDREGRFELHRHPRGGAPICQAHMNVDDLWPKPVRPRKSLINHDANPDLPISLSTNPFPLLLAVRGKVQATVSTRSGGGACVMQDRRLLSWSAPAQGANTVASGLPRGRTLRLEEMSDGRICVIKAHRGGLEVSCRVFLPWNELQQSYDWRFHEPVLHAQVRGDIVILAGHIQASVRSLATGEQLAQTHFPFRIAAFVGRYLRTDTFSWLTLAWDGLKLRPEPMAFAQSGRNANARVVLAFDRRGSEGAWWLNQAGEICSPDGKVVLMIGAITGTAQVSEDGDRLMAVGADGKVRAVDLTTSLRRYIRYPFRREDWDNRTPQPIPPFQSVNVRFDQIAITEDASLHLRKPSGAWRTVFLTEVGFKLVLDPPSGRLDAMLFKPIRLSDRRGFTLTVASWPDGRRAWLDDRGMLHLRCADRSKPEVTIALGEPLALWSSDGYWTGHPFFVGNRKISDPALLLERLRNFCRPAPLFRGIEA